MSDFWFKVWGRVAVIVPIGGLILIIPTGWFVRPFLVGLLVGLALTIGTVIGANEQRKGTL